MFLSNPCLPVLESVLLAAHHASGGSRALVVNGDIDGFLVTQLSQSGLVQQQTYCGASVPPAKRCRLEELCPLILRQHQVLVL